MELARVISRTVIGLAIVGAWLYAALTGNPAAEQLADIAGVILAAYFLGETVIRQIANGKS